MVGRRVSVFRTVLGAVGVGMLLAGCAAFGRYEAGKADGVAYKIISQKQKAALGEAKSFSLSASEDEATSRLLRLAERLPNWGEGVDVYTTPTYVLSLSDTLAVAIAKNRDYQTHKEQLFSQALSLSNVRYDFAPNFFANGEAAITRTDSGDSSDPNGEVEKFGSGSFTAGVTQTLASGAQVSLRFTKSFIHYLTGDARESSTNSGALSITQPLLNGFGPLVTLEPLTQAERSMIYAVRDFQRYQQSFVIDIMSAYYRVLQNLDRLRNEYVNLQNAKMDLESAIMMTDAGRMAVIDLDQTRQRALTSQNNYTNAQADYLNGLDAFKLLLGVPIDLDIGPDPKDLEIIREKGLIQPAIDLNTAVESALQDRLDLLTAEDRTSDSARRVKIALQNFLPNLDAKYSFSTSTDETNDTDFTMDFAKNTNVFGFNLVLPLDWTPRRNAYRNALLSYDQTERSAEQLRDSIIVEVRGLWRQLERSRQSYEIQVVGVQLAQRRVESSELLIRSGQAIARDLNDARNDLVDAKNSLTDALVSYTIQRLEFWNSIERLKIDSKGMWYEQDTQ